MRLLVALMMLGVAAFGSAQDVVVGSKKFTESYVLGEVARQSLEARGAEVQHKQGMGGTLILWQALKSGAIHTYPEYTGTIGEEILKLQGRPDFETLRVQLAKQGIGMTPELGFNNTYAVVMRRSEAERLGIRKISDLQAHPGLRVGMTHEFLERKDGWKPLAERYRLPQTQVQGIEHALGYQALARGSIDLKDAYSTDSKIAENDLAVLGDDLQFFPAYRAVYLYRLDAPPVVPETLAQFAGKIDDRRMTELNALAERTADYATAARSFLQAEPMGVAPEPTKGWDYAKIIRLTGQHVMLVLASLAAAVLVGLPLGILAARSGLLGQAILVLAGVLQTIPSLALLALFIPLMGIGFLSAVVALFLYSLLPIVRNTAAGIQSLPAPIRESAIAMGLTPGAILSKIELPMASRTILAGIKTSAIVNVGTATLAALIGAGGLGELIISGINLTNGDVILQGALPAAALAVLVQIAFEGIDRFIIPRGLRLAETSKA